MVETKQGTTTRNIKGKQNKGRKEARTIKEKEQKSEYSKIKGKWNNENKAKHLVSVGLQQR